MTTHILLFQAVLILYLVATLLYLAKVIAHKEKADTLARWVLLGGSVLQLIGLITIFVNLGHAPISDLHESLGFFAWCLVLLFLLFDLRYRLAVLGVFISALAAVAMLGSGIASGPLSSTNPALNSWWFPLHITFAFLGNAAFAITFAAGIMYLLQHRMLKSKQFSGLYQKLPSLDTLDNINYRSLTLGFPLMTMGIISGSAWAESVWGTYWSWDPKETWALITWFIYAALLHGRLSIGWRGKRAAIFAIVGFICLLFSFLGVNLFLHGLHSFDTLSGRP